MTSAPEEHRVLDYVEDEEGEEFLAYTFQEAKHRDLKPWPLPDIEGVEHKPTVRTRKVQIMRGLQQAGVAIKRTASGEHWQQQWKQMWKSGLEINDLLHPDKKTYRTKQRTLRQFKFGRGDTAEMA